LPRPLGFVHDGDRSIEEGEGKIQQGRDLRKRADRRAARMLEEAEALRRAGENLREDALPNP